MRYPIRLWPEIVSVFICYTVPMAIRNAHRRWKWTGVEIENCETCGVVYPSTHCRTVGMRDGSDVRECKGCRQMRSMCTVVASVTR
jgi:hypothetical protein